jgi:hypothetical protein
MTILSKKIKIGNYIGSVMVSVLASSVIDCGYELRSCQTEEYKIGICCFSAKNAALRRKSKDWLARNQNNVSESDRDEMSNRYRGPSMYASY